MWGYAIFLGAAVWFGSVLYDLNQSEVQVVQTANVDSLATNILIYSSYVNAYAAVNAGMQGSVPDSSLGLPAWFAKRPEIANVVANGSGFVFTQTNPTGLLGTLSMRAGQSVMIGSRQGVSLVSPDFGVVTGIALPAGIPNGAVVVTNAAS